MGLDGTYELDPKSLGLTGFDPVMMTRWKFRRDGTFTLQSRRKPAGWIKQAGGFYSMDLRRISMTLEGRVYLYYYERHGKGLRLTEVGSSQLLRKVG